MEIQLWELERPHYWSAYSKLGDDAFFCYLCLGEHKSRTEGHWERTREESVTMYTVAAVQSREFFLLYTFAQQKGERAWQLILVATSPGSRIICEASLWAHRWGMNLVQVNLQACLWRIFLVTTQKVDSIFQQLPRCKEAQGRALTFHLFLLVSLVLCSGLSLFSLPLWTEESGFLGVFQDFSARPGLWDILSPRLCGFWVLSLFSVKTAFAGLPRPYLVSQSSKLSFNIYSFYVLCSPEDSDREGRDDLGDRGEHSGTLFLTSEGLSTCFLRGETGFRQFTYAVLASFMFSWRRLGSFGERKAQLGKCSHQIGLCASLWYIFLIGD